MVSLMAFETVCLKAVSRAPQTAVLKVSRRVAWRVAAMVYQKAVVMAGMSDAAMAELSVY